MWTDPAGEPDYVFPYSIASLPPADQREVEKGIHIQTEKELRQLLEDYLS